MDCAVSQYDISSVDFHDVDNVNDFAYHLVEAGNSAGIFLSVRPLQSSAAVKVYQMAKAWVNAVKRRLLAMTPSDALKLVDTYEIMHQIAYRSSAKSADTTPVKLAAFDAMLHGDKSVDEYMMYRMIRKAIHRREKAFFDRPFTWTCICEERWHREAVEGFDRGRLTDYDILNRLTILLETDLFAYEGSGQDEFKRRLIHEHSHYLTAFEAPDRRTASALATFRLIAWRFIAAES